MPICLARFLRQRKTGLIPSSPLCHATCPFSSFVALGSRVIFVYSNADFDMRFLFLFLKPCYAVSGRRLLGEPRTGFLWEAEKL